MRRLTSYWMFLAVNTITMLLPIHGNAAAVMCADVFTPTSLGLPQQKVEWKNDRSYLEASQNKETYGLVRTFFSEKWGTQVFHTNTGVPNHKGEPPLVDPAAKAVVLFFHGSGTSKSSGRNFIANMNTLANMGYSALSIDMPFHANGPRSENFNNSAVFMEWLRSIVLEAKKANKPIFLAGHSFGPDVALEFAARYPKTIDGVIGLSPAGFTKELSRWYDNYTTKMNFGGAVAPNDAGGIWAARMSDQFLWAKGKLADPTVVNPDLRVRILSGNREEYVPAPVGGENKTPIGDNTYDITVPLKKMLKNAMVTIEPGVGHYLFDAVDKDGYNVVMRELLLGLGENPANAKKLIEETRKENVNLHLSGQLAKKYSQDPLFRAWADMTYGPKTTMKIAQQGQDKFAQKVMETYALAVKERDAEIYQKVLDTKNTHPEFYDKYRKILDTFNPKVVETTLFNPYLTLVLKGNKTE